MKEAIAVGSTSIVRHVFIQDDSATDGAGKTGLAFGDFSCRYIQPGGVLSGAVTAQDIAALGTYATPTANTNIRVKEVSAANWPGLYEVQFHNDWFASGQMLTVHLAASGAADMNIEFELTAIDLRTALNDLSQAQAEAACDAAIVSAALGTLAGQAALSGENVAISVAIAALENISAAQVNAEVADVIKVDTIPQPTAGAPPTLPTLFEVNAWLWATMINEGDATNVLKQIKNAAGAVIAKATVSGGATTTRQRFVAP